jgi:hypothetical protein
MGFVNCFYRKSSSPLLRVLIFLDTSEERLVFLVRLCTNETDICKILIVIIFSFFALLEVEVEDRFVEI